MVDRAFIGVVSEPRSIEVEKGQLKFFAKATGETNAIYFDEAAAARAGHHTLPAPLTYMFCLASAAPAKRGAIFGDMGVDQARVLHGEQSFTHYAPIYAGDVITLVTETIDIYSKKGGALEFVVRETAVSNQRGEPVADLTCVTVIRNG